MFKFNNNIHKLRNGCLAMVIVVSGCFVLIQNQANAGWWNDIHGVGSLVDITKKVIKGDFKGAGEDIIAPVKKVLTGIKTFVKNPSLLINVTVLAAQCAPKIVATAAGGAGAPLLIQDFLSDGPCTQFNRMCSEQMGDLVCPNIDGLRNKIVSVCQEPSTQQAIAGTKAAKYCEGTVANNSGGKFSQNDQTFGAQPNAQDMQVAQAATTVSADSLLQMNEHQMTQLLQMHQEEFYKLVAMNENQRRDFLAALDKDGERWAGVVKGVNTTAMEGRKLDHETVMELITGSRQERDVIYQNHKAELDRLIMEYNAKIDAAQTERDVAVKKVADMLTSLNRQLIMAQVLHVNCSRAIDDYTFCTMIRYRNDLEKCVQKANVKNIACFE